MQVSELERCHGDLASSCLAKIHPHFTLLRDLDIRFYDNANNAAATILDKYSQVSTLQATGSIHMLHALHMIEQPQSTGVPNLLDMPQVSSELCGLAVVSAVQIFNLS